MIDRMADDVAKDFVEKLIMIGRFPKAVVKDLIDCLVRKQHQIKCPAAWLMVSMRKEQPCRFFAESGGRECRDGANCKFKHTLDVPVGYDGVL